MFILQNKLLKSKLIYYYDYYYYYYYYYFYYYLQIPIMFWLQILTDLWLKKTKHHGKKHFWWYHLKWFFHSKVLEFHIKKYLAINQTKSVLLPEEDYWLNINN